MKTLKPFCIRWSEKLQCVVVEEPNPKRVKGFDICGYFNRITGAYQWLLDNGFIDSLSTDNQPNKTK